MQDGDGIRSKRDVDRELIELLNELRVALPGVQVLFAFLLTVPFTARFESLGTIDRRVYFFAVASSALASTFLIAPSAHHRMRFRDPVKGQMLRVANRLALLGLAFLVVGVASCLYLVTHAMSSHAVASIVAGGFGALTCSLWFLVPLLLRPDRPGRQAS